MFYYRPWENFFTRIGFNLTNSSIKPCLDWSERKSHLSGDLAKWILTDLIKNKWEFRDLDSRAIEFTTEGLRCFYKKYGVEDQ